ncbi:hypothetical protein LZ30DRAFT_691278 [Colletotrichum cereale]|nr:hypothetical protein LZ30DRAFT_691278 [Colletotrichum cereale]
MALTSMTLRPDLEKRKYHETAPGQPALKARCNRARCSYIHARFRDCPCHMGFYLSMEEWEGAFAEGGWRCLKPHVIEPAYLSIVFEIEHASRFQSQINAS